MSEKSVEYRTWKAMRWRCSPKNPGRNRYFDRGISVCERWDNFAHFLTDVGFRPEGDYSLDRIDNNRGYSPDNCRWATRIQQTNNTGRTNYYDDGIIHIALMDIARMTNIHPETIRVRIKKGWSIERVMAKPDKPANRERNENGRFI